MGHCPFDWHRCLPSEHVSSSVIWGDWQGHLQGIMGGAKGVPCLESACTKAGPRRTQELPSLWFEESRFYWVVGPLGKPQSMGPPRVRSRRSGFTGDSEGLEIRSLKQHPRPQLVRLWGALGPSLPVWWPSRPLACPSTGAGCKTGANGPIPDTWDGRAFVNDRTWLPLQLRPGGFTPRNSGLHARAPPRTSPPPPGLRHAPAASRLPLQASRSRGAGPRACESQIGSGRDPSPRHV